MSWVRSEVGELGGLYAPRQAPRRGWGGLRWCSLHLGARPRQTPKTTVKPHQGGMERPALVLSPPRRASWAHPTAARYTHGGTVHPRRHGTPTAARYTPRRHGTPTAAHTTAAHGKSLPNSARRGATEGRARRNGNLHKYAIPRALIYGSLTLFNGDFRRLPSLQGSFIVEKLMYNLISIYFYIKGVLGYIYTEVLRFMVTSIRKLSFCLLQQIVCVTDACNGNTSG